MDEFEWANNIEESKDRKAHLWYTWKRHIDETSGPHWAGLGFYSWCCLLLTESKYFDRMCNGKFYRKDALDVVLCHSKGLIDIHEDYPWEWKKEVGNELR
jgi:hypothetical protein